MEKDRPNILIDFSSVRTGGGVQLAVNFLRQCHTGVFSGFGLVILLPGDGELSRWNPSKGVEFEGIYRAPASPVRRWFFCRTTLQKWIKRHDVDAIYTFFGPGLPCPPDVANLVSVAYPIICYPESLYWKYAPRSVARRKKIFNFFRCRSIRRADRVLAETDVMKKRLIEHLGLSPSAIETLAPVPTSYVDNVHRKPDHVQSILLLSGCAPHKNLWRLYDVAYLADKRNLDIRFLLSVDRDRFFEIQRNQYPLEAGIQDRYFEFTGSVPSEKIGRLYEKADAILNISDLESFSNNYMEAWLSSCLLICSDRDFSRHICQQSAVYVEPHCPESIVDGIETLVQMTEKERETMLQEGKKLLATHPDFRQRTDRIGQCLVEMIERKRRRGHE